ncbi:MAG: TauD/TfdA family dioxygenase [Pigmentiphaga sp.]|nr:TauD/TfdA family dioxygenase [Pigmentiphaga sp.]
MNTQRHRLTGREVWNAASFGSEADWVWQLEPQEIDEMLSAVEQGKAKGLVPTQFLKSELPMPRIEARMEQVREELEEGRGFALLRGLPVNKLSDDEARILFWGLSMALGVPEEQDASGQVMHSVTNTGLKVEKNNSVRSYQTDDELTFHNDGGDGFMLLCLRTALSGGVSKLVSVSTIYNEVLRQRPDLLELLEAPWDFDTRGQHPHGLQIQRVPILNFHAEKLSILYKRRYLLLAQEKEEVEKWTQAHHEAIALIEAICNDPANQHQFTMKPGDIQIGNNYSVLHSRTKYQDHDDPAQRRHLLRAWVTLPNGRALPPAFASAREFAASYARRHGSLATA